MKTFKQFLAELKIIKIFHVGEPLKKKDTGLKSLASKIGIGAARDRYRMEYGPDLDKRVLKNHPRYVHAETDERMAKSYLESQKDSHEDRNESGKPKKFNLYDIRPGKKMNKVETDKFEGGHAMVRDEIPRKYIRNVWDEKSKKWKRFK